MGRLSRLLSRFVIELPLEVLVSQGTRVRPQAVKGLVPQGPGSNYSQWELKHIPDIEYKTDAV